MTKITNFVWNPVDDCIISELDGTGAVQAVYTNEPQQYGGVISQRRGTTTSTYHTDALGSTRFLTDSSGNVTDTYLHDAWGNSVAATGTTVNPFKWVGKYGYYTDNSTAQVYVRARMYQPMAARWISVDPLELESAISDFLYAGSSPVVHLDPSGLIVVDRVQGTGCAGRCGAFAQPWRFSLSNGDKRWAKKHCKSDPATGKTPGYLVQEIIREAACNDDCCDSKWKPPLNLPEIDRFWEAFYIRDIETSDGPDDPQPGIPNQQGYTDAWIQPDMGASRGKSQITSHIRLYCVFGGSRPTGQGDCVLSHYPKRTFAR